MIWAIIVVRYYVILLIFAIAIARRVQKNELDQESI